MNILGISCFYHDSAAVLIRDGLLVAAAEEERFSRLKHDSGFPTSAIDFCLRQGALKIQDLDYVVFYEKPFRKFERLFLNILTAYPRSAEIFRDSMASWVGEKLWVKPLLIEKLGINPAKILFSEHHLSHAASAFFCSPFKEAAILTVDGVGEWSTATMGRGKASWVPGGMNQIELFSELRFPHSLGLLYSTFTAFLGFEVNEGEFKVMGMAPFGRPRYVEKVMKLLRVFNDGSLELDLSFFCFHFHRKRMYSNRFIDLFGPPRDPRARFVTSQTSLYDDTILPTQAEMEQNQYYADVAASIQRVTEEIILKMARHLQKVTGLKSLCLAGGVALNSVANYRLLRETPFDNIYIQPAAGDSGGALGAALYLEHAVLGRPRRFVMDHASWGRAYSTGVAADSLRSAGARFQVLEDENRLLERVTDLLLSGKVVGWVQGRFEWGPRALGQRSILADPRRADMKDIINVKIKFREPFRPFAPSVVQERIEDFFEFPDSALQFPPRFMLMVSPIQPDKRSVLSAVTHLDGTGRLQSVIKGTNPLFHGLLTKFGEASGVPILLNTSFNLKGEPIVTTPADAFRTFSGSGMDALVVGPLIVIKENA